MKNSPINYISNYNQSKFLQYRAHRSFLVGENTSLVFFYAAIVLYTPYVTSKI